MENIKDEEQAHPDLLIPDGYPEIIFVLNGAYRKRVLSEESKAVIVNKSSVIGIQIQSQLVKRIGKVKLLGVKFKPMGFYQLLGELAPNLAGKTASLDALSTSFSTDFDQNLQKAGARGQALEFVDHFFSDQFAAAIYSQKELLTQRGIEEILKAKGTISLDVLSARLGRGERQIQRYFKTYLGISPKKFANLIRFKALYKKNVLSEEALSHFFDHGYFDQSHFIKDFRNKLGITPSLKSSQEFRLQNEIAKKSIRS